MTDSNRDISKVLQDTFDELQEELLRQKQALKEQAQLPADEENVEKSIEELVDSLARHEGFEVKNLLGAGGMGAVVRAIDLKLKRTVALKFLPPEVLSDPKNASELRQEAEIASGIQNENVVQIFSWHEVDNVPFYAMEFIEGETVEQLVNRRGKLPTHEALRITAESARGLEALHANGIIHRDIKPHNIMISRDGRVKITDFGISRTQQMISTEMSRQRKIAGTPKFMAPEQARGEAATKASDIYSLGATLYFMLTGRPPVETAVDMREQIKFVRESRLIPITRLLPKLDKNVARLIMRSLSPTQSKRPWDIATFRQELEEAFLSQTVRSRAGVRAILMKNRHIVMPLVGLFFGILIGAFAGYRLSAFYREDSEILAKTLDIYADRETQNLNEMARYERANEDPKRLLGELENARSADSDRQLARLLPSIAQRTWNWQTLQMMRREAMDTNSPLHQQSLEVFDILKAGDVRRAEEAMKQWREEWFKLTNPPVQPTPSPTPVPQAAQDPAAAAGLFDVPGSSSRK